MHEGLPSEAFIRAAPDNLGAVLCDRRRGIYTEIIARKRVTILCHCPKDVIPVHGRQNGAPTIS